MKKIFLLAGFQNWGKTTLIKALFNSGSFHNHTYPLYGQNFRVIPQSNDDVSCNEYLDRLLGTRKNKKPFKYVNSDYIFAALCPTKESGNDSANILLQCFQHYKNVKIVLILIEHKWCGHAILQPNAIGNYYINDPQLSKYYSNLKIEIIRSQNCTSNNCLKNKCQQNKCQQNSCLRKADLEQIMQIYLP